MPKEQGKEKRKKRRQRKLKISWRVECNQKEAVKLKNHRSLTEVKEKWKRYRNNPSKKKRNIRKERKDH